MQGGGSVRDFEYSTRTRQPLKAPNTIPGNVNIETSWMDDITLVVTPAMV